MPTLNDLGLAPRRPGKRGKLPARHIPTPALADVLRAPLPDPSGAFDYASKVSGGFPMALNDTYGDCTIAGVVHVLQLCYAAVGQTFTYPGDAAVETTYFDLTGGADTGLNEADVLRKWMTDGLFGTKIVAFGTVKANDLVTMRRAVYAFGHGYTGVDLPGIAEQQFADNEPWTLEPGNNPPVGGHCTVTPGWGATLLGFVPDLTWGAENEFSTRWWQFYGEEFHVVFPEVFVEAGHGPLEQVDLPTLSAACQAWATS